MGCLLIVTVVLAFAAYPTVCAVRRHRKPPELRGDWWTPFERELRAYAERTSRSANRDGHQRGGRRPTNPGSPSAT
jgi:hypothetical protein